MIVNSNLVSCLTQVLSYVFFCWVASVLDIVVFTLELINLIGNLVIRMFELLVFFNWITLINDLLIEAVQRRPLCVVLLCLLLWQFALREFRQFDLVLSLP